MSKASVHPRKWLGKPGGARRKGWLRTQDQEKSQMLQDWASLQHSLLHLAQLHSDNQLRLSRHVLEHIGLEPPKHVRPQQVMQLFDLIFLGDVGKFLQEAFQIAAIKSRDECQKQGAREVGPRAGEAGQASGQCRVTTQAPSEPASHLSPLFLRSQNQPRLQKEDQG